MKTNLVCWLIVSVFVVDGISAEPSAAQKEAAKEAIHKIVVEANKVAAALKTEPLPITETNLTEVFITPPELRSRSGTLGTIDTGRFKYCASRDLKLSYVLASGTNLQSREELTARYKTGRESVDTNAAIRLARQWLEAFSVDMDQLDRNTKVSVHYWTVGAESFVPVYALRWSLHGDSELDELAVMVELVLPSRALRTLAVEEPALIKRKPLQ